MRKDMHKVLTERTRGGGSWKDTYFDRANNFKHRDREILEEYGVEDDIRPPKESIRKRYVCKWQDGKQFRDHLSPLKRYLRSQVGRPWNKVWSEICAILKGNGLQAAHVKGHIHSEVDGITFSGYKYFHGKVGEPYPMYFTESLYVDKRGILRICPRRKKKSKKK